MPKNLESYLGVDKPEEKKVIEVKGNSVTKAFQSWTATLMKINPKRHSLQEYDYLLGEAVSLLAGLQLPRKIRENHLAALSFPDPNLNIWNGLFYTALLNAGVEEVHVPKHLHRLIGCGYKLQKGILRVFCDREDTLGLHMEGGCIINYGVSKYLGLAAEGGIIINEGCATNLGEYASGGTFINRAYAQSTACYASGGLFIDYACPFFEIIFPNQPDLCGLRWQRGSHSLMGGLLSELETQTEGKARSSIPKIEKLIEQIEQEVKSLCPKI